MRLSNKSSWQPLFVCEWHRRVVESMPPSYYFKTPSESSPLRVACGDPAGEMCPTCRDVLLASLYSLLFLSPLSALCLLCLDSFSALGLLSLCFFSRFVVVFLPSFCRLFAVFGSFFLRPFFVLCSRLTAEWVFAISGVGV